MHRITVYDAACAALAHTSGLPLVTADDHLVGKLAGSQVKVMGLGDLQVTACPFAPGPLGGAWLWALALRSWPEILFPLKGDPGLPVL